MSKERRLERRHLDRRPQVAKAAEKVPDDRRGFGFWTLQLDVEMQLAAEIFEDLLQRRDHVTTAEPI